jgi:hypothetical protein
MVRSSASDFFSVAVGVAPPLQRLPIVQRRAKAGTVAA